LRITLNASSQKRSLKNVKEKRKLETA